MPLFICSKCQFIENTALSMYWNTIGTDKPPLCSVCDPDLEFHGRFSRIKYADLPSDEQERVLNPPEPVHE